MTVNGINGISQVNFKGAEAPQGADVSVFANQSANLEAAPAADTLELTAQEQPKKSKKGLLIGLGALAAAAVAVGIGIKTGKIKNPLKKNDIEKAGEQLKKGADEAKEAVEKGKKNLQTSQMKLRIK